jgi:DNA-binding transcriptional ArsR family regulator
MVEHLGPTTLDRTYAALSHPIRRGMIELLRGGDDLRVTEIAEPFSVSLAAASKHVRVLESAGLVSRTIIGRDHVLTFEPDPLAAAHEWIDASRSFWEARLDALATDLGERRRR